jgi:hypothetical protein
MVGSCCARAEKGHVTDALPINPINSRRFIPPPGKTNAHLIVKSQA